MRNTALTALIACRKTGAWSDGVLKDYIRRDKLDRRDAALASRLFYGVIQNQILLDFYIASLLKGKLKDLQPVVLDILRLGVYQLAMMDKIPPSAAVNEAVIQGKKFANVRASGLINGILRSFIRSADELPEPETLGVKYSHPEALVSLLEESVGTQLLEPLLMAHNAITPTVAQINPLIGQEQDVLRQWEEENITFAPHPWQELCYYLSGTGDLQERAFFASGSVCIQDAAAKLAVVAAGLEPDMQVLDCCAAPGGKSFAAAMEMNNKGKIIACDIHPHKMQLIEKGAQRLGISIIETLQQDGSKDVPSFHESRDVVFADVPCSGLGVIRKKPDIRYKNLDDMKRLPEIQLAILENVCQYVKKNGVLLYSTCTILRRENEEIIHLFLSKHKEFQGEIMQLPLELGMEGKTMVTLLPCSHHTDGFFIAKLRRIS